MAVKIRVLLRCDAVQSCGRMPTFPRSILPPSSGWRQHGPLKRWYPIVVFVHYDECVFF